MLNLARHVGSRQKVRLHRNRPSESLVNGYLLALRNGLLLMHPFDDFEPDGYMILREKDVVGTRSDEYERHWDRMLKGEGLLQGLAVPPQIDLAGLPSAIKSVAALFRFMAIHCEDEHEPLQDFYLGELAGIAGDTIQLRCIDALGRWEGQIADIPATEITMVEFDTPYIKRFTKYISA